MAASSSESSSLWSLSSSAVVGFVFNFTAAFVAAAGPIVAIVVDFDVVSVSDNDSIDSADPDLFCCCCPFPSPSHPINPAVACSNADILSGSGLGLASSMSISKNPDLCCEALCRTKCSQRVASGCCRCCCCFGCEVEDGEVLWLELEDWQRLLEEEQVVLFVLHDMTASCLL